MPNNPQHPGSNPLPSLIASSRRPKEPLAPDAEGTGDLHRRTADVIFPDASRVSPELRRAARTARIIYGLDAGKDWPV